MRILIPDIRARTGVFALMQNIKGLEAVMDSMPASSAPMQAAYDKMKDTPENQIKIFKNEISKLGITLGGAASKGLLPFIKMLGLFINAVQKVDPVTKDLLVIMSGAGASFMIWKLGLSSIVFGLKGAVIQVKEAAVAMQAMASSSALAGIALKTAFAGTVVYTGYQLIKLAKAAYEWLHAVKEMKDSENRLYKNTDRLMKKFAEFKDVKLPDDITGKAPEELKKLRDSLLKTRAYWQIFKYELEEKSKKTGFFGSSSKEIAAAAKKLKFVNKRLAEVRRNLAQRKRHCGTRTTSLQKNSQRMLKVFMQTFQSRYRAARAAKMLW